MVAQYLSLMMHGVACIRQERKAKRDEHFGEDPRSPHGCMCVCVCVCMLCCVWKCNVMVMAAKECVSPCQARQKTEASEKKIRATVFVLDVLDYTVNKFKEYERMQISLHIMFQWD